MDTKGPLIMSEGAPVFREERGIFILSIPSGGRVLRYGFLPHDFIQATRDSAEVVEQFRSQNTVEVLRRYANGGHAASPVW